MWMQTESFPLILLALIGEYISRAHLLQRMSQLIGMFSVVLTDHDRLRLYKWMRPEPEPTLSQPRFSPTVILYVHAFELVYPCLHSCSLEPCCHRYARAQRPAPCRYQMRWWHLQKPLPCLVHYNCRLRELRRSFTRCRGSSKRYPRRTRTCRRCPPKSWQDYKDLDGHEAQEGRDV